MDNQKCPNCAAPMMLINNRDGTTSYKCEYCGYVFNNRPKTATDKVFSFINRAVNALKEDSDPLSGISPEKRAEFEQKYNTIKQKEQELYEKAQEKRMKTYEKILNKRMKKY